jgi:hypothetical protein
MIQLNLLPDLKKEFLKAQKVKGLVISVSILVTLGAIGLSALLFVYVTFVQQLQVSLASDDITRKMQQLKDIPDVDKYLTIQNQLQNLPSLHEGKGMHSRLFSFLNVLNPGDPNDVTLGNLQLITGESAIILTGTTATFESLNVFVDTLKNAQITYQINGQGDPVTENMFDQVLVQTSGLVQGEAEDSVGFTIRTKYRDAVFAVTNKKMTAKVPNITTTPSVTQSPKPVFDDNKPEGQ